MVQQQQNPPTVFGEPDTDIVARAQDVAALLKLRASAADRARELPVENMRDLHEAGLMTLAISDELGGTEADLITQMAVYEIIGGACASTAWCLGNHGVMCTRLACWGRGQIPTSNRWSRREPSSPMAPFQAGPLGLLMAVSFRAGAGLSSAVQTGPVGFG